MTTDRVSFVSKRLKFSLPRVEEILSGVHGFYFNFSTRWPWGGRRVSWTSFVALSRFVWAVQYGARVGDGPRASCSRVAPAVRIRKLKVTSSRGEDFSTSPNADEIMLDWLVTSVRFGWTPREVLVCFFPVFGDILFLLISDIEEEG